MRNKRQNKILLDMVTRHETYKQKMPAREFVEIFDWQLDLEQNEDWVTWEMEFSFYGF